MASKGKSVVEVVDQGIGPGNDGFSGITHSQSTYAEGNSSVPEVGRVAESVDGSGNKGGKK